MWGLLGTWPVTGIRGDKHATERGCAGRRDDEPTLIAPIRPAMATYVGMHPRLRLLSQLLWIVIVVAVAGACVAGAPIQYRSMLVPAETLEETVSLGRLLPEEQAGLASIGISMEAFVLELEIVAMLVHLLSVVTAAILFWSRRDSWIAWVASLFLVTVSASSTFNIDALARDHPSLVGLSNVHGSLVMLLPALLLFQFPSGRFAPRWGRWIVLLWGFFLLGQLLIPERLGGIKDRGEAFGFVLGMSIFVVGAFAQIHRYRKVSTSLERQQTKWVVAVCAANVAIAVVITATLQVVPGVFESPLVNQLYEAAMFHVYELSLSLFPVAFGFAILRYRLWDVDFIINRSIVYAALTACLTLFFGISVLMVRQLLLLFTDGQHLPVALGLSMLVVGLTFQPARRFLHRFVNRRFYGIEIVYRPGGGPTAIRPQHATEKIGGLGDFEDIQLIGRGGMADVYRARHRSLGRIVALKILPCSSAGEQDTLLARFDREAEIIAKLRHPNIVELLGRGVLADGTRYIVLEFVSGSDLADLLHQRRRLSPDEALPFLDDMARALDYAHGEGIVHRDIKPSNILLDPLDAPEGHRTHRAVLADFGIAKLSSATQLTATHVIGTLDYIAPEQIQDSADVDGRADVYSVGVLLYQLLTGERPFSKHNPVALMLAHLQQPPPDPRERVPGIPDSVADCVLKAMDKDPDQRHRTVGEMVDELSLTSCSIP